MLTFVKSDIFTLGADALVLPANRVGTLGGGRAASFNRRYPDLLLPYRAADALGLSARLVERTYANDTIKN